MSSTGLKNNSFNYLESDNIDVYENLNIQNINILDLINNDISGNINIINNKLIDLSNNLIYFRNDNPEKIIFYDSSSNKIILKQININNEILFKNFLNQNYTKIGNDSELYIYHDLDITLPLRSAGFWNVHDELSQLQRDTFGLRFDVTNLQAASSITGASITDINALLTTTTATATTALITGSNALALAGTKNNIIKWNYPLFYDSSDNAFFKYDNNYFSLDVSNNLTFNNIFWKKDVSNNLYYNGGKIGIGITQPNYLLDVSGNINCFEIYRNGTPISSTLSLFLPLSGGILSGGLTATTISATSVSAATFSGSGASLTSLNASNISSGTLTVSRGGIGTTTLSANQILIGNGTSALLQSTNLTWNNTSNTLSATNFIGSGTGLSALNASNITSGTLPVSQGGIGTTTLTSGQILVGNGTSALLQSANLTWNNTSNSLTVSNLINISGANNAPQSLSFRGTEYNLGVAGAAGNYSSSAVQNDMILRTIAGSKLILQSGTGAGAIIINSTNNVTVSNTLTATSFIGSGTGLTSLNASNITSGTLNVSQGGIGTTTLTSGQILIGNGTNALLQSANLTWNNISNTLSASNFIGSGTGLTSLNASNITSGTLLISQGGTSRTSFNSNQLLIGNGINAISQTPNLIWDSSNNELDVSGNINGNNLSLKNLTNVNNTLLSIISETTTYNSKLLLGSGFSNNPINSFLDVSTCQVITKTNNLYIDAALGKTININTEANGNINSYGPWQHNGDISCNNNIKAVAFIENNISLTNKYIKKYAFNFTTTTPITLNNTTYYKYDINLNSYSNVIYFGTTPNRKFKISTWLKSGYHEFTYPLNLDYEVIMSSPVNAGTNGAHSGLNILAYGFPYENYYLNKVTDSQQFLLRNSFDYLSYFSNVNNTAICCMILDYF